MLQGSTDKLMGCPGHVMSFVISDGQCTMGSWVAVSYTHLLKNIIKEFVESKGYEVIDLGTNSTESCDYPVYGEKVGRAVASGEADLGIAICGTGVGISLAANKVKGIRACVCSEPYTCLLYTSRCV